VAWILPLALGVASTLVFFDVLEHREKVERFREAREYCDRVGKPLLNVGCGQNPRFIGDVNVDVYPSRILPGYRQADVHRLPFRDKEFGAAVAFSVLEHVDNPAQALRELSRVADRVYVTVPHYLNPYPYFRPGHKWVFGGEHMARITGEGNLLAAFAILLGGFMTWRGWFA